MGADKLTYAPVWLLSFGQYTYTGACLTSVILLPLCAGMQPCAPRFVGWRQQGEGCQPLLCLQAWSSALQALCATVILQEGANLYLFSALQALTHQTPWGGSRPLRIDFTPGLPANCPMRSREGPLRAASSYVWCAGLTPPEQLVAIIREAGLPSPTSLLRVGGRIPGAEWGRP